jgi:RHS repeat-associated protein
VKYDAALRPIEENVASGTVTTGAGYVYDADGRLTGVGSETLAYRDSQRVSNRTHGVVTESYAYSPDFGELAGQDAKVNGVSLYAVTYTRDALGRIASQRETVEGMVANTTYGYDDLGRLASVQGDTGITTYSYDANGNRLDGDAVYDAQDRLTRRAGVTYEYTADGDLLHRTDASGTREYTYDVRGQLRKVSLPEGKTIAYVIDALGRRIAKQVDGKLKQAFVYDLAGRVRGELDASGTMTSRFIYGARLHVPDFIAKDGMKLQLLTDARGSVRLVVDVASGQVVQRLDYDAWGNVLRDTSPGLQPFGFAGGLWDGDTRLVRFGARDYDAEAGRWTAKDPILFDGGDSNLYAYVGNDPINLIDPKGTDAWSATGAFVEGAAWSLVGGIAVSAALASGTVVGGLAAAAVIGYGAYSSAMAVNEVINGSSSEDRIDAAAGLAGGLLGGGLSGWGFGTGYEFTGNGWRVAPWGNRTGNAYGEYPHYHRRVPHPNPRRAAKGEGAPGGSIGRHRPWEPAGSDKSWCDKL